MATAFKPAVIADTFEAFVIGAKGQAHPTASGSSMDECLRQSPLIHKQHFYVKHTDGLTGEVMLSFYVVKKAKPVLRFFEHQHRMVADLYAEHLFDLAGDAL